MAYKTLGALLSMKGGVLKPSNIKSWIDKLSMMGYNHLELCTDDTYEIDGEPYFGYLNGRYTKAELKDLDAYAKTKGIELVPCIQTLAHQESLTKIPAYHAITDIDDILLVDEPKTYELIDKMFKTMRECYTTDQINIGFDEAHKVGLGKYLDKHGYTDRFELLLRHLNRVDEIAKKYGFKLHMWSDMFCKLAFDGKYFVKDGVIPDVVREKLPKGVALCMWGGGEDEEVYRSMIKTHRDTGAELWCTSPAGHSANGFAPFNNMTLNTLKRLFKIWNEENVENVFLPMWGDQGTDCSRESAIISLYAASQFAKGNFDMDSIKKGFKEMFGVEFDDILLNDIPNKSKKNPDCLKCINACKALIYNDVFVGWKDSSIEDEYPINYGEYAQKLEEAAKRTGPWSYLSDMYAKLCRALEVKYDLGLRTRKAYKAGDKEELRKLVDDYSTAVYRIGEFKKAFKKCWMTENKPYNWEVHEIRLGGTMSRIMDCRDRLIEYLNGEVDEIPELNEVILPYADWGLQFNLYRDSVTVVTL